MRSTRYINNQELIHITEALASHVICLSTIRGLTNLISHSCVAHRPLKVWAFIYYSSKRQTHQTACTVFSASSTEKAHTIRPYNIKGQNAFEEKEINFCPVRIEILRIDSDWQRRNCISCRTWAEIAIDPVSTQAYFICLGKCSVIKCFSFFNNST